MSELVMPRPVADPVAPNVTNAASEPKRKLATWKKVVAGVVAAFIALFVIASMATSGPATASNEFVDNMLSGNSTAAYGMFSKEAQKTITPAAFSEIVVRLDSVLTGQQKMISKYASAETGSAATGKVVYEIAGTDGTYKMTVNLVKESDTWKVLNFENNLKQ